MRWLRLPIDDYLAALVVLLDRVTAGRAVAFGLAAVATWWIYVPVHELAHAAGCLLGGGTVQELEIDAIYGAAWLQRWFPFVTVGSEYAGRLSGFDTGGSDATYLLTDFLPFVLTILIGVPLLRASGHPWRHPLAQAIACGAALPLAFAPFISLIGDYYEMGSILVTRAVATAHPGFDVGRWRADDLPKLVGETFAAGAHGTLGDALGIGAAFLLGCLLAWATYAAGVGAGRAYAMLARRDAAAPT